METTSRLAVLRNLGFMLDNELGTKQHHGQR